mmetsp:Transcript_7581/g.11414  ORF Transcript_7581/g.11414 Transcript_7581/m.11414 type:complete len:185 (-) Transcript_7581:30-584(-)
MNPIALVSGFSLFLCYTFLMVGTATPSWRKEKSGVSYFDKNYGLWELCFNGNDCEDVEQFMLPGETTAALKATRVCALLSVVAGLCSIPCLCAIGLAGKCFCLTDKSLGTLTCFSVSFMLIFAIVAFSVFVGVVEEQFELESSIWEYGYSFALFTTGWSLACCFIAPTAAASSGFHKNWQPNKK